jgi:hypothetical protein
MGLYGLDPPEGIFNGSQIIKLVGNWTLLKNDDFDIRFGNISVQQIYNVTDEYITIKNPASELGNIERN